MSILRSLWYIVKNILFILLCLFCFMMIETIAKNPYNAIWVMIILFIIIPTEYTKVMDLGDGWGLFSEDFTGCIAGGIIGLLLALALGKFISNNQGIFAGSYMLIIASTRGVDYYRFKEECSKFTNIVSLISAFSIVGLAITLLCNNDDPMAAFNTAFGIICVCVGLLTWVYTMFAHAAHADDVE